MIACNSDEISTAVVCLLFFAWLGWMVWLVAR